MNCARCYNHGPCMYGDAVARTCLRIAYARLDTHRAPVFDQHAVGATTHDDAGAMIVGILQIGLHGRLATAEAAAEITPAAALLAPNRVAVDDPGVVAEGGSAAAPDTMRRVTTTLEALSTYAGIPDTPQPGRLTDDVQPPGFEALAALVPTVDRAGRPTGPPRVIKFEHKPPKKPDRKTSHAGDEQARAAERLAQRAAAQAAVDEAEHALRESRKAAQRAEEELKKAAAQSKEMEAAKLKAEQALERATADADEAKKHARAVAAKAEEAAQEVEDAERALAKAQAIIDE